MTTMTTITDNLRELQEIQRSIHEGRATYVEAITSLLLIDIPDPDAVGECVEQWRRNTAAWSTRKPPPNIMAALAKLDPTPSTTGDEQ